jgi:hypothetical protein
MQMAVAARDLEAAERSCIDQLGPMLQLRKPNLAALTAGDVRLLVSETPGAHGDASPRVMFYLKAAAIEAVYARIGGAQGVPASAHGGESDA